MSSVIESLIAPSPTPLLPPLDAITSALNSTLSAALLTEDIDPETCELLGPFALVIQAVMGVIVLGSLLLKRAQEKPKRKWKVWLGDVGKQVVGQAFVHSSNVLISDLIARHKSDNPCSLYMSNIAVDTTLGVLIVYGFLKLSTKAMVHFQPDYRTGDYGHPPQFANWAKQAAVYVVCLGLMKVVVVLLFWAFPAIFKFANWCLSWLTSDEAQVVFVMLIFPLVMNLFQFLTLDSILKSKEPNSPSFASADDDEARRGFLEANSDEDDEGGSLPIARDGGGLDSGYGHGSLKSTPSSLADNKSRRNSPPDSVLDRTEEEDEDDDDYAPGSATPTAHSYPPATVATTPTQTTPRATAPVKRASLSYGTAAPHVSPPPTPPTQPVHSIWAEKTPTAATMSDDDEGGRSSFEDDWGVSTTSLNLDDGATHEKEEEDREAEDEWFGREVS